MSIQNDDRYPILTQLISDVNDVLHQETHTHDNKSVLDGITQENVDKWNSGTGGTVDLSTYQQKTDDTLNTTSKEIVGAINELFQGVSNAKDLLATTLTDKGIPTVASESFVDMINKVGMLSPYEVTEIYGQIVTSISTINIAEGGSSSFSVKLDKAPTNNQVVTITKNNPDVTLDKSTLTFTPVNYNTDQTVNINVEEDVDMVNDTCIITCSSPNVSNKTITLNIDDITLPSKVLVTSITVDKSSISAFVGSTQQLNVETILPSNATDKTLVWTSSDDSIASVDNNGLISMLSVGATTIKVSANDGSGVFTSCSVNVQEQLTGIDVFKYRGIPFPSATNIVIPPNNLTGDDGDNDYVHPSVLYFPNLLFGKKYWLGVNPYNNTQGGYENPWLFCSDDGINWNTPNGVTNPLMGKKSGIGNNSDIHLFYDNGVLYILNRGARTNSTSEIEYVSTSDGVTFTERTTMLDNGKDYVSPSICKYNGKYYMFVVDITDTVRTKLTVFESVSMSGTWTQVNQINTGGEPMWHPEVTFNNITNEFLLLFSKGDAQGGAIFLGKFTTPQDSLLTICPNALVDSSYISVINKGFKTNYKSSVFINENGELVLYLGTKGNGLDANTGWRVTRHITSITKPTFTNNRTLRQNYSNYTVLPSSTVNGASIDSNMSDNIGRVDYLLELVVDDLNSFNVLPAVLDTSYYVKISKQGDTVSICEMSSGNIKNRSLVFEPIIVGSLVSILKIGTNIKIYVDGRLGCDYNIVENITKFKIAHYSAMKNTSNISYYAYDNEYIPPTLAEHVALLDSKILNSNTDSNIILADNFNRSDGYVGTSTNGVVWSNPGNISILSNKAQLKQTSRLILDTVITDNIQISFKTDTAITIYVSYTDSTNYKLLVMVSATINYIECIDGVETVNSLKPGGMATGGVVSIKLRDNIGVYYNGLLKGEYTSYIPNKNISFGARNLTTAILDNILIEKI